MKVVILAGGYGTRISEETGVRPKPMVEIGGKPIMWHIMKTYSYYGFNDFIICCGYKGHVIKEYFANYMLHVSDVHFDFSQNSMEILRNAIEPWKVTLVDTGINTLKGGRMRRVREHIGDETFCMTYGDGVCDVNIAELVAYHRKQKTLATLTAVQPPGRFGAFNLGEDETKILHFREKHAEDEAWINGGFFVLEPEVIDYIASDDIDWEQEPLINLAHDGQLSAYRHNGFWHPMDTLRDRQELEKMWLTEHTPWKVW